MRSVLVALMSVLLSPFSPLAPREASAQEFGLYVPKAVSLDALATQARQRLTATSRTPLAALTPVAAGQADTLEPANSGRVPNYLRALGPLTNSVRPFAALVKSVLYEGAIEPEVKMAMGLRMAQFNGSPYVAAHLQRFLNGTERGKALVARMAAEDIDSLKTADRLAVRYAEWLTKETLGVKDEDFKAVRGAYNDGQVVELTLTVSFFNYFTRMAEALELPVEPWVLETRFIPPAGALTFESPAARVNLVSDRQLAWSEETRAARRQPGAAQQGLGVGLANSQRAMMLSPYISSAWRAYSSSVGDVGVDRELKLHVSFAVSEANGCRYCTLHQVQGLRRLGVSMDRLMQMKKDDSLLKPRELVAVQFARKLTRTPASMTDADYQKLRAEFGDRGALEVVLQTCTFAFMNRFTDGLRLPSEDEAIKTYREVYKGDFQRTARQ